MYQYNFRNVLLLVSLLTFIPAGCLQSNDGRVAVQGEVTLDGAPLPAGDITFIPLAGGYSAGGTVVEGKFEIARHDGPQPGKHRVEIVAFQTTGKTRPDSEFPGRTTDIMRQIIPAEYNERSMLEAEIGDEPLRFSLNSR